MSSARTDSSETTCDGFLDGRVKAYQPVGGPRAAIDAVLLAAAIPAVRGRKETVLDAGTGTGLVSLSLAARVGDVRIAGVELQDKLCALARQNVDLNGYGDRISVIEADLTLSASQLQHHGLGPESFDHVAANPPFLNQSTARVSPSKSIALAHAAAPEALEQWVRFLARMVRPGGTATLIHRADALNTLLALMGARFGALSVLPIYPRAQEAARRLIVQGVKGSRAPLTLMPGLVLHREDGGYTAEADAVLKSAEALTLGSGPKQSPHH